MLKSFTHRTPRTAPAPRSSGLEIGGRIPPPTSARLAEALERLIIETPQAETPPTIILGKSQERTYTAAMSGKNIFITGPGGTGKSELLGRIIEDLRRKGTDAAVTASTGVAALRVGGSTIHSFLGTNICDSVQMLKAAYQRGYIEIGGDRYSAMLRAKVLIVDEVSMLTGDYLDMVDYHLRDVCSIDEPFGGKQAIFCGDFLQLPPVVKDARKVDRHFAFQSKIWELSAVKRMALSENFRQKDAIFIRHLNAIRFGELPPRTARFLGECAGRDFGDDTLRLFPVNRKVDALNMQKLRELPGEMMVHPARFDGDSRFHKALVKNTPVPERLQVKIGARVMLCRNDYQAGYRNGQRGVLLGRYSDSIGKCLRVELDCGAIVRVDPFWFEWKNDKGDTLAGMEQYPIKLAWAVSIHKSQGSTLDKVVCDLSGCFEAGQVYVALSRVRSADGLALVRRVTKKQVFANKACVEYYPRVRRVR